MTRLKLRGLLKIIVLENVCIYYKTDDGEFKDIYKGRDENVPEDLLDAEVMIVSAKKKGVLDIRLNEEDIPEKRKNS